MRAPYIGKRTLGGGGLQAVRNGLIMKNRKMEMSMEFSLFVKPAVHGAGAKDRDMV